MKNLEYEHYELKELSLGEAKNTNGGENPIWRGVKNLCKAIYIGGKDFIDGFNSVDCETRK